jgi:phage terminase large subunit
MPEDYVRRYVEGEWGTMEGVIYSNFSTLKHVKEFDSDSNWTYFLSIDWGFNHPFVCLLVAIDHDGHIYVVDELYRTKKILDELTVEIKELFLNNYNVTQFIADLSEPQSTETVRQHLEIPHMVTEGKNIKAVKQGIQYVKTVLHQQAITIHPRCINLIREFGSYIYDSDRHDRPKEEPLKLNDDGLDALRYFCMANRYTYLSYLENK